MTAWVVGTVISCITVTVAGGYAGLSLLPRFVSFALRLPKSVRGAATPRGSAHLLRFACGTGP